MATAQEWTDAQAEALNQGHEAGRVWLILGAAQELGTGVTFTTDEVASLMSGPIGLSPADLLVQFGPEQ